VNAFGGAISTTQLTVRRGRLKLVVGSLGNCLGCVGKGGEHDGETSEASAGHEEYGETSETSEGVGECGDSSGGMRKVDETSDWNEGSD
jgi:hypothetical protein